MKIQYVHILRGPNAWSRYPVLDIRVVHEGPATLPESVRAALLTNLPTLAAHTCHRSSAGFGLLLRAGTDLPHLLEHVARELQSLAGLSLLPGWTEPTAEPAVHQLIVAAADERVCHSCVEAAERICQALLAGRPVDVAAEVRDLRELADRICLGPTLRALLAAAQARAIPVHRFPGSRLLQLGHGSRQCRVRRSETSRTSAIARILSEDKDFTNDLLRQLGVPVPRGRTTTSAADAWQAAQEIGPPVVIKPKESSQGRSVFTALGTQAQIETAFHHAAQEGGAVLVEQFILGAEHRLLVVAGQVVAACRGEPAWVMGDGQQSIAQLIEAQLNTDPRRGAYAACPLDPIQLDSIVLLQLEQQGYGPETVVPAGTRVLIRRSGNLAIDETEQVHRAVAARAVTAARVLGLDVAGIDIVADDIGRPLEEQGGVIVDVNAGPGLQMHLQPEQGQPRPVAEAILASLLPTGQTGRIPVVALIGAEAGAVAQLLARLLEPRWGRTARTTAEGVLLNGQCLKPGEARDPLGAVSALLHPEVDAAVFEIVQRGRLDEDLGFDRCDVAIVAGPADAGLTRSLLCAVASDGWAIFTGEWPNAVRAAPCPGRVLVLTEGAYSIEGGVVIVTAGEQRCASIALDDFPEIEAERAATSFRVWLPALLATWHVGRCP